MKKTKNIIYSLLKNNPTLRDNDNLLYWCVLQSFGVLDVIGTKNYFKMMDFFKGDVPKLEAVSRVRRLIQETEFKGVSRKREESRVKKTIKALSY